MRGFIYGLLAAAVAVPMLAQAQQLAPAEQIGVLAARLSAMEGELNNAYLALIRERTKSADLVKQVEEWKIYARPLYAPPTGTKP